MGMGFAGYRIPNPYPYPIKTHGNTHRFSKPMTFPRHMYDVRIFENANTNTTYTITARRMLSDKRESIRKCEAQLKATTCKQIKKYGLIDITEKLNEPGQSLKLLG